MPSNLRLLADFCLWMLGIVVVYLAFGRSWFVYGCAGIFVIYFATELLVWSMPTSIRRTSQANRIRLNGSISANRSLVEERAINKLRRGLSLVLLLVSLPTVWLLWVADQELFPINVGVKSVADLRLPGKEHATAWNTNKLRYEKWQKQTELIDDQPSHRRLLRSGWPMMLACGSVWLAVVIFFIHAAYFQSLRDFSAKARFRAEQYRLRDHSHTEERSQRILRHRSMAS